MPQTQPPTTDKLVDFKFPPVSETLISLQFANPVVDIAVLAAFATAVVKVAPQVEHQVVLPRMQETFNAPTPTPMFELVEQGASLPRTWFGGNDGFLIQLQPDRLTVNWRRDVGGGEYPGYQKVRTRFDQHFGDLQRAAAGVGRELPPVDLCEVSYINPVLVPGDHQPFTHPDLAHLINRVKKAPDGGFLGQPEDAAYQARWRIAHPDDGERPIGRLHVSVLPNVNFVDQTPIYLVNMTARVLHEQDAGYDAANIAHEHVVLGFEDLTTPEMHVLWNQKEPA